MDREIKFRSWDKELKQMHICGENVHDSMSFIHDQACYYNLQNGCGSLPPTYDGEGTYELMQYTGLKDKNGKEIYEGDILKCKVRKRKFASEFDWVGKDVTTNRNYVVEWWESSSNIGYRVRDGRGKTMMVKPSSLNTMEVEVIGNIYENPELLDVKE